MSRFKRNGAQYEAFHGAPVSRPALWSAGFLRARAGKMPAVSNAGKMPAVDGNLEGSMKSQRSRLEPQQLPRRDFLGLAAFGSAALSLLFAFVGIMRLPKAAVLPSPSKRFRVTLPESLAPDQPYLPPGRSVALYRTQNGGVYAVSTICTHLGCIVKPTASGFDCPCHGSKFGADGSVLRGPAPKSLPRFELTRLSDTEFLVDEGTILPAESQEVV